MNTETEVERRSIGSSDPITYGEEWDWRRGGAGFDFTNVSLVEANGLFGEPVIDSEVGRIKHTQVRELVVEAEQNVDDGVALDDGTTDKLGCASMG